MLRALTSMAMLLAVATTSARAAPKPGKLTPEQKAGLRLPDDPAPSPRPVRRNNNNSTNNTRRAVPASDDEELQDQSASAE